MKRVAFVFLVGLVFAADKPMPEITRLKLVNAYQAAYIQRQNFFQAQAALNAAMAKWNEEQKVAAVSQGLPEGTTYTVDLASGVPAAVLPQKKADVGSEKK